MNIGEIIEKILMDAKADNRLICGLSCASQFLKEADPERSLFFFIAPSQDVDSITHMQEVVLQAFCFESDIYIIKIDSGEKLSSIVGSGYAIGCALVQIISPNVNKTRKYTDGEMTLIDHCEDFWNEPIQPTIKLPEK